MHKVVAPAKPSHAPAATMFDKIWATHSIHQLADAVSLLHVDRHFIHDLEAGPRLNEMRAIARPVARPDLTFATPDHAVSSAPGRNSDTNPAGSRLMRDMRRGTAQSGLSANLKAAALFSLPFTGRVGVGMG